MRFLVVFLIIVLCVSIGGPLLRHHLLTKHAQNEARAREVALGTKTPAAEPPAPASVSLDAQHTESQNVGQTDPASAEQPEAVKPDPTFSILGEIIDVNEETPIPGVQVFLIAWRDASINPQSIFNLDPVGMGMTDDEGRFGITDLREAVYGLVTHHETYIQTEPVLKILVGPQRDQEPAIVTMEEGGVVMGQVSLQGTLLPRQQITLEYPFGLNDNAVVSTDEVGAYIFEGLHPGRVKVAASVSTNRGLIETAFTVRVESGKVTLLDLPLDGNDASISGQVIPYATETTYNITATSSDNTGNDFVYTSSVASDGTFFFPNMPYGRFRIVVEATKNRGYLRRGANRRLQALVRTFPGQDAHHDFYFSEGFGAEGYVPNLAPNDPLTVLATNSIRVTDLNPNVLRVLHEATSTRYAFVDRNGGFRFDNLEPGTYQIIAESGPNRFALATVHVASKPSNGSRDRQPLSPLELWLQDN